MYKGFIKYFKSSFTLIELIIVIAVLGVLAAIIIPNISTVQEDASVTAMVADGRNTQTSVDIYQLYHYGNYPVDGSQPTITHSKEVDFSKLHPHYTRDIPEHVPMYYWVDVWGKVWYSTLDNPTDFIQESSNLTWTPQEGATKYSIYEIVSLTSGSMLDKKLKLVDKVDGVVGTSIPNGYDQNKTYLISVHDKHGFQTAPAVEGYTGSTPLNGSSELTPEEPVQEGTPTYNRDFISEGEQIIVSSHSSPKVGPDVSADGRYVVWTDYRSGNYSDGDIYGKDLVEDREFAIYHGANGQFDPQITPDGRYVVWYDFRNSTDYDIYGKDLVEDREMLLHEGNGNQLHVKMTPDLRYLVWHDSRNGNDYDIYGKDLVENREFLISDAINTQMTPNITPDGRYVVWYDSRNGDYDIYGKDLVEDREFAISTASGQQYNPQITSDGRYVIWQDYRDGKWDIYGKDLIEDREFVVVKNANNKEAVKITPDGRYIVWQEQDVNTNVTDIYGKDLVEDRVFVISEANGYQTSPDITPDGKIVVYATTEYGMHSEIVMKDISHLLGQ